MVDLHKNRPASQMSADCERKPRYSRYKVDVFPQRASTRWHSQFSVQLDSSSGCLVSQVTGVMFQPAGTTWGKRPRLAAVFSRPGAAERQYRVGEAEALRLVARRPVRLLQNPEESLSPFPSETFLVWFVNSHRAMRYCARLSRRRRAFLKQGRK